MSNFSNTQKHMGRRGRVLVRIAVYLLLAVFLGELAYIIFFKKSPEWILVHSYHLWFDLSAILLLGFFGLELLVLNRELCIKTKELKEDFVKLNRVEEALLHERNLAQRYLDVAGVILLILDKDGKVVSINRKGCEILGQKEEDVLGLDWFENFLPQRYRKDLKHLLQRAAGGEAVSFNGEHIENTVLTRTGEERIIDWHNSLIKDSNGVYFVVSSGEDITQRKRYEEYLKQALRDKEVLLKEVHHRVKNNLLILYALITFQQKILDNTKDGKKALEAAKQRIRAIGRVHQLLYISKNFMQINFAEYIRLVIDELSKAYNTVEKKIEFEFDLEPVVFELDTAIPCGLIINELLLNVFEHAFHGKEHGVVRVGLRSEGNTRKLSIADNGIGMSEDLVCEESKTLGMRLIFMLTRQLRGHLLHKKEKGSSFVITF